MKGLGEGPGEEGGGGGMQAPTLWVKILRLGAEIFGVPSP